MADVDELLGRFIDDWNAGRRPDLDEVLAAAPDAGAREELLRLVDAFVATAPLPAYSPAQLDELLARPQVRAAAAAFGGPLPPAEVLAQERARAGLDVRELAGRVAAALGFGGREAKVAWYLDGLESGDVDPQPVSARAWEAVAGALGIAAERLTGAMPPPAPAAALLRDESGEPGARDEVLVFLDALGAVASPGEWDEVDEAFRGS
jgi:hypothetical protein